MSASWQLYRKCQQITKVIKIYLQGITDMVIDNFMAIQPKVIERFSTEPKGDTDHLSTVMEKELRWFEKVQFHNKSCTI